MGGLFHGEFIFYGGAFFNKRFAYVGSGEFHFSSENRARGEAKLSIIPTDSAGKNTSKYVDMWENFFGEAVRHSSKLIIVKKSIKIYQTNSILRHVGGNIKNA